MNKMLYVNMSAAAEVAFCAFWQGVAGTQHACCLVFGVDGAQVLEDPFSGK